MNRLNNALKQRDAAREEALLSKEELKKLQEDVESGALVPQAAVAAAAAAAAASPAATPTSAQAPSTQYDPGRKQLILFTFLSRGLCHLAALLSMLLPTFLQLSTQSLTSFIWSHFGNTSHQTPKLHDMYEIRAQHSCAHQQPTICCYDAGMIPQARKPIPVATPMTPPSHALQEMNGIPPASMYTASSMRPTPSPGKLHRPLACVTTNLHCPGHRGMTSLYLLCPVEVADPCMYPHC